jgi:hypothetical protein
MSRRSAPADSDTPTFAAGFINHKVVSKAERRAIHEAAEKAAQEKKAAKKAANQAKIDAAAQAKEQRKAAAARKAERKARHEAEVQAAQERKAAKQAAAPAALAAAGAKKKSKQIVDTAEGERSREERYRAQQAQHRAPAPKLPMPRKEASSAPRAAMKPEPASHKADEVPRFDAAFTFPDDAGPSAAGPSSSARVAAAKEEEAEEEEGEWMGDASFTLDAAPSQPFGLEALAKPVVRAPSPLRQEQQVNGLLLPGHVQIDAPAASPERTAAQEEEARKDDLAAQGELGDYAQLDDTSGKGRYYDAEEKAERMAREECPVCGELGHDKKGCTHSQVSRLPWCGRWLLLTLLSVPRLRSAGRALDARLPARRRLLPLRQHWPSLAELPCAAPAWRLPVLVRTLRLAAPRGEELSDAVAHLRVQH